LHLSVFFFFSFFVRLGFSSANRTRCYAGTSGLGHQIHDQFLTRFCRQPMEGGVFLRPWLGFGRLGTRLASVKYIRGFLTCNLPMALTSCMSSPIWGKDGVDSPSHGLVSSKQGTPHPPSANIWGLHNVEACGQTLVAGECRGEVVGTFRCRFLL
jgi:hypothetical protein